MSLGWIAEEVCAVLEREASAALPDETGGILLGYWSENEEDVVVLHAIGPGPKAKHTRSGFEPDAEYHEAEIARIYHESGRHHVYLGDWHTHPGKRQPGLSFRDRLTLRRIALTPSARLRRPLMAIIFNDPEWKICLFRYVPFSEQRLFAGLGATAIAVRFFTGR